MLVREVYVCMPSAGGYDRSRNTNDMRKQDKIGQRLENQEGRGADIQHEITLAYLRKQHN